MKKTVRNLAFLFVATLLTGFSFTSCDDDDNDKFSTSRLIGSWQETHREEHQKVNGETEYSWTGPVEDGDITTFFKDGAYEMISTTGNEESQGTWSLIGDVLTVRDEYASEDESAKVVKLTDSEFVIEVKDAYSETVDDQTNHYESYLKTTFRKVNVDVNK